MTNVSIIINTDGRVDSLSKTLESLRHLTYSPFEVCVVYGPTPDGTKEYLESWTGSIKVAPCLTRNLSESRNIAIALAAGEIIAFLDDDSIPEPEWLSKVTAPFSDPEVGGCGGFLLDHTGTAYQWRFGTADRTGKADESWTRAAPELNFPYTANFPHVMANSAFRRSAVLDVGGFDEQFVYFLDETDLICRLVDGGYRIVQLEGAPVHHKFAPSSIRSEGRVLTSWDSIVRSKIYFSIVNARGHHRVQDAIEATQAFITALRGGLETSISEGKADPNLRTKFQEDVDSAFRIGLSEGLKDNRLFYDHERLKHVASGFAAFPTIRQSGRRKTICFLSQAYPPGSIGGIGRYIHQAARSMAELGHQVHVITKSTGWDTVDFEDGVWVHRLVPKDEPPSRRLTLQVPRHIWNYSATALNEVRRIRKERDVDVVYAPIWDCEGLAFIDDGEFRLVTSLQTMLLFWLDSHPHMAENREFMASFADPMMEAERYVLRHSCALHAISHAITSEISAKYAIDLSDRWIKTQPLGAEDWSTLPARAPEPALPNVVRLLFVGRLEERKGIDVLFSALKTVLGRLPNVIVDIVGNDRLLNGLGLTFREEFEQWLQEEGIETVRFHGEVDDGALRGFYEACDVFVAPSRFESFGLILLEAMMFGKPVIACRAGGMQEVVEDEVTGLLAEPGDALSLGTALERLLSNSALRQRLGRAGRLRYEAHYKPDKMAAGLLAFFDELVSALPS